MFSISEGIMIAKLKQLKAFYFATLLCIGAAGCTKESHETVVVMTVGLQTVNEYWIKHGKPKDFEPSNVMNSSWEHYYILTNVVNVAGKPYHCRFAVRSKLVHIPGAMAITDEGVILWIRDKDGKVVVSPQKNGIE
jgi:hypothetical protein